MNVPVRAGYIRTSAVRAEKAEARARQLQEALFRIWAKAEPVKEGRLAG